MNLKYKIKRTDATVQLTNDWSEGQWAKANVLELNNFMGEKPLHFPKTQVKLLYDNNNIFIFFRVEDRYVKAISEKTNDPVWRDSCVEFFFTPNNSMPNAFFNLETNCGGIMYFQFNKDDTKKFIDISDCQKIEIYHSLPRQIKNEINKPSVWYISYRLPVEVVAKYCQMQKPCTGAIWKANFYKCADKVSHPHWLTWSFIDNPTPNFHLPQFFGTLEFE
jgi:hypothetical protein